MKMRRQTRNQAKSESGKTKRKGRFKMIFGIVMAVIVICVLIGSVLHATYFTNRKNGVAPYGEMVDVFDGQMHVYKTGSGEQTIVLLPGAGVALPSADFGPLMRQLGRNYSVVALEYFGVGFSSQTRRDRKSVV